MQPGGNATAAGYLTYHDKNELITTLPNSHSVTLTGNGEKYTKICKQGDPGTEVCVTVFSDTAAHVTYKMGGSTFYHLFAYVGPLVFRVVREFVRIN